jgi:putative endonuclease
MPFVYILQSLKNNRYYIGSTNDIERRLSEHNNGKSRYTSLTAPFRLVLKQEYSSITLARRIESKLKKLKNRSIIEKIIKDGHIKLKT